MAVAASPSASHSFPLALLAAASALYRSASDGALALAALRAEAGWGQSAGLVGLTFGVVMPLAEAGAMVAAPVLLSAGDGALAVAAAAAAVAAAAAAGLDSGEEEAAVRAAVAKGPPAVDPRLAGEVKELLDATGAVELARRRAAAGRVREQVAALAAAARRQSAGRSVV